MTRFTPLLKNLNAKLSLPQPEKSRILLEIAADLEDSYNFYRTEGLSEAEAIVKAEEKFAVSDEAIYQLMQIHESAFRRFMDRLSEQAKTRWERISFLIILLFIAAFSSKQILTVQFFMHASKLIWLVLGCSFAVIILFIAKFYSLYIKKDYHVTRLRRKLPALLFFAGGSLLVGAYGFFIELYFSATKIIIQPEKTFFFTIDWLAKSCALIVFSLLVALFTALIWFVFYNKVKKIEQAEVAFLLSE